MKTWIVLAAVVVAVAGCNREEKRKLQEAREAAAQAIKEEERQQHEAERERERLAEKVRRREKVLAQIDLGYQSLMASADKQYEGTLWYLRGVADGLRPADLEKSLDDAKMTRLKQQRRALEERASRLRELDAEK